MNQWFYLFNFISNSRYIMIKEIIRTIREQNSRMENAGTGVKHEENRKLSGRRDFIKKSALGGIALGGLIHLSIEDTIAQTTSKVNRSSSPSDLKITDMRVAVVGNVGRTAII